MPSLENSEVMKQILQTLIAISTRKTTEGYAVSTLITLLKGLEPRYQFLRHIEIRDIQYLEDSNPIHVLADMNTVPKDEMGQALSAIISTMTRSLGKNAGYFFIKEIQRNLDEDYNATIRDMGVDLNLLQLEYEVSRMEQDLTRMKKTD